MAGAGGDSTAGVPTEVGDGPRSFSAAVLLPPPAFSATSPAHTPSFPTAVSPATDKETKRIEDTRRMMYLHPW